jgi:hypothetical protein
MRDMQANKPFFCAAGTDPRSVKGLPDRRLVSLALLVLLCVLNLVWWPYAQASPSETRYPLDSSSSGKTAVPEPDAAEVQAAGTAAASALSPAAGAGTATRAREDLTVFFSIGIVLDVLLATLFAVWAVGQWRKTRK